MEKNREIDLSIKEVEFQCCLTDLRLINTIEVRTQTVETMLKICKEIEHIIYDDQ